MTDTTPRHAIRIGHDDATGTNVSLLPVAGDRATPRADARDGQRRPPARPDARPMRIAWGLGSIAALSALATAIVAPPPAPVDASGSTTVTTTVAPVATPQHVVRYVQLKPGQTAPPQAVVQHPATPQPRVVTVVTRQSGIK